LLREEISVPSNQFAVEVDFAPAGQYLLKVIVVRCTFVRSACASCGGASASTCLNGTELSNASRAPTVLAMKLIG